MNEERDDQDLRASFAGLRDQESRAMPGFRATLLRQRSQTTSRSFFWWVPAPALGMSLAMVLALAAIWVAWPGGSRAPAPVVEWTAGQWAMPSDVLLDLSSLPGSQLMGEFETSPLELAPSLDDARRREGLDAVDGHEERSWG